jgi:hexosaminidase
MKKATLIFSAFLVLIFFSRCGQETYPTGNQLAVSWKVISNEHADQPRVKAMFTIENNGSYTLKHGNWAVFYNQQPREILENPEMVTITRVSGDWYKLEPTEGFILKPGEKTELIYEAEAWWIKEVDAPLGVYFVFYDKNGVEKQIVVAENYTIEPFTDPEQINRHRNDFEPIPTAELLYNQNQSLVDLPAEKLPLIVPTPFSVKLGSNTISFDSAPEILYQKGLENEAKLMAAFVGKLAGTAVTPIESSVARPGSIFLGTKPLKVNDVSKEAYRLEIKGNKSIVITGSDHSGVFYGMQSLMALLPPDVFYSQQSEPVLPELIIEDAPRFGFRSLHVDVARNFQTKETLKKFIDLISFYKLNHLMLVLSEDEAWRIAIQELPELTDVASRRGHTVKESVDMLHPAYGSGPFADNPDSYGSGYYSREDYKELLQYARQRHVTIIPTINLPGHSRAAIRAMESRYQRFSSEGDDERANEFRLIDPDDKSVYKSAQSYNDNVVCVARESVYKFYETVIDDIIGMHSEAGVPLEYFHTGGDEVPEGAWAGSPLCQEMMKDIPGISDPKNLQAVFFKRVTEMLQRKGLKVGGWEEVALLRTEDGNYIPNPEFAGQDVIPWAWNNMGQWADLSYRLANAGYPVVMCDVSNFYYDLAYNKDPEEPGHYWGGFANARSGWQFAPYNSFVTNLRTGMGKPIDPDAEFAGLERLKPSAISNIIGLQAQLWSETIKGPKMLEYYTLPKFLGFVETAWSKARPWETGTNAAKRRQQMDEGWNVFANMLAKRELPRLAGLFGGFNYRIPQPGAIIEEGTLKANVEYPGLIIRYTTDGTEPVRNSLRYDGPVEVPGNVQLRAFDKAGNGSRVISVKQVLQNIP